MKLEECQHFRSKGNVKKRAYKEKRKSMDTEVGKRVFIGQGIVKGTTAI